MWVGEKRGFIAKEGSLIEPQLYFAGFFQEGLARVKIQNKFGFIDSQGKIVIGAKPVIESKQAKRDGFFQPPDEGARSRLFSMIG